MHLEPDAAQRLGLNRSDGGVLVVREGARDVERGVGSAGAGTPGLVQTLNP